MPFSLGNQPLKIRSIGQHVGNFKHHLNGYFVVFGGGLFPGVTSQVCYGPWAIMMDMIVNDHHVHHDCLWSIGQSNLIRIKGPIIALIPLVMVAIPIMLALLEIKTTGLLHL